MSGVEMLQQRLPPAWYAFTNLDLATAPGSSREIDVIIVAEDRILLVDLKDWRGPIESDGGRWLNAGRDSGASPIPKLSQNVRDVYLQLKAHLKKYRPAGTYNVPFVQGMVVLTDYKDLGGIAATERAMVSGVDDFINDIATRGRRVQRFGPVNQWFISNPLTSPEWKDQLRKFFNVTKGVFVPGRRDYGGYFANSDAPVFRHPDNIYQEFEASDERASASIGTLRLWDFTKADAQFQTEDGRAEIAGREQAVVSYLQDRSERCDAVVLGGRGRDSDYGVAYWEIYDRRRRLARLTDFAQTELRELGKQERLELSRQLLSALDALHMTGASHLDVGSHSVWVQRPSTVKVSHLMAASYPQVNTLGESRYQFLSASPVPEEALGLKGTHKQRDVFLLGLAVHRLLFGTGPTADEGCPPDWDPAVDEEGDYAELHGWFATALDWEPSKRFREAGDALAAFVEATVQRPTPAEVVEGLETFRGSLRSMLQLFSQYPPAELIRDDDRKALWRSERDGVRVLVKVWKRAMWGDQVREGARILDFLTRSKELAAAQPPGCARILEVYWLGDAIVQVQEWSERPSLATLLTAESGRLGDEPRLDLTDALARLIEELHARHLAHGDLKPANILVDPAQPAAPMLIDIVDFGNASEGELLTSAYAPDGGGGRYERDCFAVTRIAEELLADGDRTLDVSLRSAIELVRTADPANSTLLPLVEALSGLRRGPEPEVPSFRIVAAFAASGVMLSDEGLYYLRPSRSGSSLVLRGACEEIEIEPDGLGRPGRISRRSLDQKRISSLARFEFASIAGLIEVVDGPVNDALDIRPLLERPDVIQALGSSKSNAPATEARSDGDATAEEDVSEQLLADSSELSEEELVEEIAASPRPTGSIDVARLWEVLVDAERDLETHGEALEDSVFDRNGKRHLVQFQLQGGSFDYDRKDRVLVERQDHRGNWRRIGYLDLQRSRPASIVIDDGRYQFKGDGPLVAQYEVLRFKSHFEERSLERRHAAVTRIVRGNARIRDLVKFFDPRAAAMPTMLDQRFTAAALETTYGLNTVQAEALAATLRTRPLGLVQGPPGTGKTKFIAALVHAALSSGLARNVLLSSQAHEAVNNAAEAVLKLFAEAGEVPSIIRVGNENVVSDRLLPFHAARVERLYKDRFQAEIRSRLLIAADALGIGRALADKLTHIELAIRPVVRTLSELGDDPAEVEKARTLRETIRLQLVPLMLEDDALAELESDILLEKLVQSCSEKVAFDDRPSPDRIAKFLTAASLARDFVTSVSTEKRSFETFLAGTRQIVAGTCVGLGRSALGLTSTPFDLVIVDEAARCTASELAVPIQAGSWVVLVGDQNQLEPHYDSDVVKDVASRLDVGKGEVVRSDFERVFESGYGGMAGRTLRKQYRMLPAIGEIVSESFYAASPLEHGRTVADIPDTALPPDLTHAVTWIDTAEMGRSARQSEPNGNKSISNPVEADAIVSLLKRWSEEQPFVDWVEAAKVDGPPIGIICAYSAQRDLVRRKLQSAQIAPEIRAAVKIDTVDSYQGKQNPIVIVTLVRNNWDGAVVGGDNLIKPGFLATPNRINVALSRAMDRLVIIGTGNRWQPDSPMDRIAGAFTRKLRAGHARRIPAADLLGAAASSSTGKNRAKQATEMMS
ncbi:hypothetical protein ASF00_17665 [Sphingomonas sp. Leaf34]|nr:hypothetical protein ASF00_17665 [Sphingomonas sp. Leaf34]